MGRVEGWRVLNRGKPDWGAAGSVFASRGHRVLENLKEDIAKRGPRAGIWLVWGLGWHWEVCWALDHVTGDVDTGEERQNSQFLQSLHAKEVSVTGVRMNRRGNHGEYRQFAWVLL